jgi:hypothetical protein
MTHGGKAASGERRAAAIAAAFQVDSMLVHAPKRRGTALLLCLLLGWMGAHRFYVGKNGTGRLYLLTGGLFCIGVIVDVLLILANSFEDRYGRPLTD